MPKQEPSTGIADLDRDLKDFFSVFDGDRLIHLKGAIGDTSISKEDFRKAVPPSVVRLVTVLRPPSLVTLLEKVPKENHGPIERALSLIQLHDLEKVLEHPRAMDVLMEIAESESGTVPKGGNQFARNLKVISGLSMLPMWIGNPPNLAPAVRIGFRNRYEDLLLDSTLDWDDLFFLISSLAEVAVSLLEGGRELSGKPGLGEGERKKIARRIGEIRVHVAKITDLAPEYGISVDKPTSSNEGPDKNS